ncbi:MAG: hypothetical protein LBI02_00915 [Opitutaceae bacterium]|nr:hypothetical protein [Opitutaceae bacterium]
MSEENPSRVSPAAGDAALHATLRETSGFSEFRQGQLDVIRRLMAAIPSSPFFPPARASLFATNSPRCSSKG